MADNKIRLIDANALLEKSYRPFPSPYEVVDTTDIENAPTIDAEPVKHGRWLLEREPDGTPYYFHCSVCDSDYRYIGIKTMHDFCPHCGAKMDEGGDSS